MIIKFDNNIIDNKYIMSLSQNATLFAENFQLGSTLCRTVNMSVYKDGVVQQPSSVIIEDDDNNRLFTLQVDSINNDNINVYSYVLTDSMVNLNVEYDWSVLESPTVQNIVDSICEDLLQCQSPTVEYMGDLEVNWSDGIVARDFISYVAEVNGGFARIDNSGNLEFVKFVQEQVSSGNLQLYENSVKKVDGFYYAVSNGSTIRFYENKEDISLTRTHIIDINYCKDFRVGEKRRIEKVFIELGVNSSQYPNYEVEGNTLYLNENNILITDSQGYTIQGILEHIYTIVQGLEFYTVKTTRCIIDDRVQAGDSLAFVLDDTVYMSIAQIDWTYNTQWIGGYEFNVSTDQQEHTQIQTQTQKINNINIKVDREMGLISQEIMNLESNVNAKFELYVDKDNLISYINASADEIVLDGSKIIFGDLENKYITLENYELNNELVGVSFDGNGYVRFRPQESFSVYNVSTSGDTINSLRMSKSGSSSQPFINLTNRDIEHNYLEANFIEMDSYSDRNRLILRNYDTKQGLLYSGNYMIMNSYSNSNTISLYNYKNGSSTNISNFLSFSSTSTQTSVKIDNYNLSRTIKANDLEISSTGDINRFLIQNYNTTSQVVANSLNITTSNLSAYASSLVFTNYDQNSTNQANILRLERANGINKVELRNYRGGSPIAGLFMSDGTCTLIGEQIWMTLNKTTYRLSFSGGYVRYS